MMSTAKQAKVLGDTETFIGKCKARRFSSNG